MITAWQVPLSKVDATYEQVKKWILDGTLSPGATIDHNSIAQMLSVSTTPLREALRRLAVEEFVDILPRRAVQVRPLDSSELAELMQVQVELEPEALLLACKRADYAERRLAGVVTAEPTASLGERLERERRFHQTLYRQCGNTVIIHTLDAIYDRCQRYRAVLLAETDDCVKTAEDDHEAIAEAYARCDERTVAELLREHVNLWGAALQAKPLTQG